MICLAGKEVSKAPKIQRLERTRITEKKKRIAKSKAVAADYQKLLVMKEQRGRRSGSLAERRSKLSAASKPSSAA